MQSGFLGVINNPAFPDMIKIITWDELPKSKNNSYENDIRYITKFNDILAAKMHLHNALRHTLIDANNDLYQTDIANAIAAIESNDDLQQQKVWIDPSLNNDVLNSISKLTAQKRLRKKRINTMIKILGLLALGLLALNFFFSIG